MAGRKIDSFSLFRRKGEDRLTLAYKAADGSWKQHRLPVEIQTKTAGKQYAIAWLAEQRKHGKTALQPGQSHTVQALSERWLDLRDENPKVRRSTVADNRSHLKTHILPTFGKTPIDLLTVPALRAWVRDIRTRIQPRTVAHVVSTFSSFFEDAIHEGWTAHRDNLAATSAVRTEVPTPPKPRPVALKLEQARVLVNADPETVPRERQVRYLVAMLTSLRDGEISGGSWSDVDLDAEIPIWRVTLACAIRGELGNATLGKPKTEDSERVVPLHPTVFSALKWWRDEGCEREMGYAPQPDGPVFPSPRTGAHWRPKSAEFLRDDLKACGLPTTIEKQTVTFKTLRSTFATWLEEAGIPGDIAERFMGHTGQTVRRRHYTAPILGRMLECVRAIDLCADFCAGRTTGAPAGDAAEVLPERHGDGSAHAQTVQESTTNAERNEIVDTAGGGGMLGRPFEGNAPVAQWIEQRFPKAKTSPPHNDEDDESNRKTRAFDAMTNGDAHDEPRRILRAAQRPHKGREEHRQKHREAIVRSLRVGELLEDGVTVALDQELGPEEKREALRVRLAEAAELIQAADGRK